MTFSSHFEVKLDICMSHFHKRNFESLGLVICFAIYGSPTFYNSYIKSNNFNMLAIRWILVHGFRSCGFLDYLRFQIRPITLFKLSIVFGTWLNSHLNAAMWESHSPEGIYQFFAFSFLILLLISIYELSSCEFLTPSGGYTENCIFRTVEVDGLI